jgi:hypothetical protein
MTDLIEKFNLYRSSHPNLSECWIAYLELKKKHYDADLLQKCSSVLAKFEEGCSDIKRADIIRVLFYMATNEPL